MADKLRDEQVEELRAAFSLFDKKGDGTVSRKDIGTVIRTLFHDIEESEIKDMILIVDPMGTGQIDFDRFLEAIVHKMKESDMEDEVRKAFRVFDKDGDGFVTAKELRGVMASMGDVLSEHDINDMIRLVDENGDGRIEYSEFLAMIRSK